MILREVSAADYAKFFTSPAVVFNSVGFTELNAARTERVVRAVTFSDSGKPLLGLTAGERNGGYYSPFSAPFACFDFNREHSAETLMETVRLLAERYPGLEITLPPACYCPSMVAKTQLAILSSGGSLVHADWNYHVDLTRFSPGDYASILDSAGRNKLRGALRSGFDVSAAERRRAYEVIRINRESKGYPLRMSEAQVEATTAPDGPVRADFFVLTDGATDAAAAMVYRVAPGIAQVIYWGDVPDSPCRNAMNLLAERLCEHYRSLGFHTLDVGPCSSEGVPSPGLCTFKEAIGCQCSVKPTLRLP